MPSPPTSPQILAWATGDLSAALSFKSYRSLLFEVCFISSCCLAFILNMSTFYCTTLNSARTQTVVGQIKNFFAFLLGLVLFDDYIYEPINFLGLWVGFAGSVWYAWVTYKDKQPKAAPVAVKNDDAVGAAAATPVKGLPADDAADEEVGAADGARGGDLRVRAGR